MRILLDRDGRSVWRGGSDDIPPIEQAEARDVLLSLSGARHRADGRPFVSERRVTRAAEAADLVTSRGCAAGFVTLLPAGVHLERCAQAFNVAHVAELDAVDVEFPAVFDRSAADLEALTADFAAQERMFRLVESSGDFRLSYAADPGLFGLLRGARLSKAFTQLAIRSTTQIFRRYRRGELGPLTKVRQYALPDLHVICTPDTSWDEATHVTAMAAAHLRFWEPVHVAQFIDVVEDFYERHRERVNALASAAAMPTLVNVLKSAPRYYSMRTGLCVDAGTGALMLYNLQWDETNPERFDIRLPDGGRPVVVHANCLAGSGLMCLVLGRSLATTDIACLPPELCPVQATLLVLSEDLLPSARGLAKTWEAAGLALQIVTLEGELGKALRQWSKPNLPAIAVYGAREAAGAPIQFRVPEQSSPVDAEAFFNRHAARVRRCRPQDPGRRWPSHLLGLS